MLGPDRPPTLLGLLNPVFAEHSLALAEDRGDSVPRLLLADRHQGHIGRVAAGGQGGAFDAGQDGGARIHGWGQTPLPEQTALWRAAHQRYRPFTVMVLADPAEQVALAMHMPWVAEMKMIDNRATAYVCRDFACDAPTTDASVLR